MSAFTHLPTPKTTGTETLRKTNSWVEVEKQFQLHWLQVWLECSMGLPLQNRQFESSGLDVESSWGMNIQLALGRSWNKWYVDLLRGHIKIILKVSLCLHRDKYDK